MEGWRERGRRTRRTTRCVICNQEIPKERSASAKTCSPACQAERIERYHREWNTTNRARRAATERQRRYSISQADYDHIVAEQQGGCAICQAITASLAVDHHHDTGAVRGLLCSNCNVALGMLADNPLLLARAAEYLQSHAC